MSKSVFIAVGFALIACVLWAGNFVVARGVSEWIAPFTLSFWRWAVALAVLLPFSFRGVRREWPVIRAHIPYLLTMGVFGVAGFNTLIYFAAHTTPTAHMAIISSTTPIFTLVLVALLGEERLTAHKAIGAALGCAGALTIITHGNLANLLALEGHFGDLLSLIAAFIWAGWSVGLRFKPQGLSAISFMTVAAGFGLLALTPFYIWEAQHHPIDMANTQAWLVFAYIAIGASLVAWLLWQAAIERIGAARTSLIYYSIPAFSSLFAYVLLKESLQAYHYAGFGLVVCGILCALRTRAPQTT